MLEITERMTTELTGLTRLKMENINLRNESRQNKKIDDLSHIPRTFIPTFGNSSKSAHYCINFYHFLGHGMLCLCVKESGQRNNRRRSSYAWIVNFFLWCVSIYRNERENIFFNTYRGLERDNYDYETRLSFPTSFLHSCFLPI